jgi:hypothetical protein
MSAQNMVPPKIINVCSVKNQDGQDETRAHLFLYCTFAKSCCWAILGIQVHGQQLPKKTMGNEVHSPY